MKPILFVALLFLSAPAFAQDIPAEAPPETAEVKPQNDALSIRVHVSHGTTSEKVADAVVFLRAARPKGPFEPTDPEPQFEWSEITDSAGVATFSIPKNVTETGLRIHAVTTYGGVAFKSSAEPPINALQLKVPVYEKGTDASALKFVSIRTITELWEDYLVFTQFYVLENTSNTVIETASVQGFDHERGMPIELPVKALGVQVSAAGEHTVVNSTAYWKGRVRPGERVPIQIRFSMAVSSADFVYEQEVDYPVDTIEVAVPLQTQFQKLPRLSDVSMAMPEAEMLSGKGIFDLRDDMDFIGAKGPSLKPGESFKFKLSNLPFARPIAPFVVLGLALLFSGLVIFFGRREYALSQQSKSLQTAIQSLKSERSLVLLRIAELETLQEEMSENEFESLDLALKARLAIINKKIQDFEHDLNVKTAAAQA